MIVGNPIQLLSPVSDRLAQRRAEIELLFACARGPAQDNVQAAWIQEWAGQVKDWGYVRQLARRHQVVPLLFCGLSAADVGQVPPDMLADLRDEARDHAQHNLLLTGQMLQILRLLDAHGIKAIPYKGPVLAARAYHDLALRQIGDLDLLLKPDEVARARDLLIAEGYQPWETNEPHLNGYKHHFNLVHAPTETYVELHWAVAQAHFSFPLDTRPLWDRLETVEVAGQRVQSLATEDWLLILCAHGAKHMWSHLKWLADVSALLRSSPQIDWDRVLTQAAALQSERMLGLGLWLAHSLLAAPLPPDVLRRVLLDPALRPLATLIYERLFDEHDDVLAVTAERWQQLYFQFRLQRRPEARLHYLRHFLLYWGTNVNDRDRAFWHLPGRLAFLYVVLRPLRLAGRYGLGSLRQLLASVGRTRVG
ncbi:MAG: nucleotidyltransferase family protein [Chloroflexi bacterium]|nr:nucleotidyltransferase family protein [Chloroflexota bacterium]